LLLPKLELMVLDDPPPHFFISDEVQLPGGSLPQHFLLPKLALAELDPQDFNSAEVQSPGGCPPQHFKLLLLFLGGHALTSVKVHEPDGLAPQQSGQALTSVKVQEPGGLAPQQAFVPNKFINPQDLISDEVQLPGGWDPQQAELPLDDDPPKLLLKELDPPQFLI
jgi:hypothetical protein